MRGYGPDLWGVQDQINRVISYSVSTCKQIDRYSLSIQAIYIFQTKVLKYIIYYIAGSTDDSNKPTTRQSQTRETFVSYVSPQKAKPDQQLFSSHIFRKGDDQYQQNLELNGTTTQREDFKRWQIKPDTRYVYERERESINISCKN